MSRTAPLRCRAWGIAAGVLDPEMPMITIEELGVLRDVTEDDQGRVHVRITPTYTGCPALETIRADLVDVLTLSGYRHVAVETVLAPPWTTDWITASGRDKLATHGIAPPGPAGPVEPGVPVGLRLTVRCPGCGSADTRESSPFGSTACKSMWVCQRCREPFDHLKAL